MRRIRRRRKRMGRRRRRIRIRIRLVMRIIWIMANGDGFADSFSQMAAAGYTQLILEVRFNSRKTFQTLQKGIESLLLLLFLNLFLI